jgi:hypothetical protein
MFSSDTAMKITGAVEMAFTVGMMCFPDKLMEGYRAGAFSGGADTTFFHFAMGIFGLQQGYAAMLNISGAKSYVSSAEKSVTCFWNAVMWGSFIFFDGRMLYGSPYDNLVGEGKTVPMEAMQFNIALFTAIALINLFGWQDSGSVMPDFKSFGTAFKGSSRIPLFVVVLNSFWFGLGCGFMPEAFIEMYSPGLVASLPNSAVVGNMCYWIFGNAGKVMIFNVLKTFSIASVGDVAASFRMHRLNAVVQSVYMGMFSRDQIIFSSMNWENPGRVMSFVQTFGTMFYLSKSMGDIAGSEMSFKKSAAKTK